MVHVNGWIVGAKGYGDRGIGLGPARAVVGPDRDKRGEGEREERGGHRGGKMRERECEIPKESRPVGVFECL